MRISDWSSRVLFRSSRSSAPVKLSNHWNARLEMIKSNHCHSKKGHSPSIVKNVPARRGSRAARSTISGARSVTVNSADRKSVVQGKSVSVRVDLGGRRIFNKKKRDDRRNSGKK